MQEQIPINISVCKKCPYYRILDTLEIKFCRFTQCTFPEKLQLLEYSNDTSYDIGSHKAGEWMQFNGVFIPDGCPYTLELVLLNNSKESISETKS